MKTMGDNSTFAPTQDNLNQEEINNEKRDYVFQKCQEIVDELFNVCWNSGYSTVFNRMPSLNQTGDVNRNTRMWECAADGCSMHFTTQDACWLHYTEKHTSVLEDIRNTEAAWATGERDGLYSHQMGMLFSFSFDCCMRWILQWGDGVRFWKAKKFAFYIWRAAVCRYKTISTNLTAEEKENHDGKRGPYHYVAMTWRSLLQAEILPKSLVMRLQHDGFFNMSGPGMNIPLDQWVNPSLMIILFIYLFIYLFVRLVCY